MQSEDLIAFWPDLAVQLRRKACSYGLSDHEDAVQETFLRLYRSREKIVGRSHLQRRAYLILRNYCIDGYRKQRRLVYAEPSLIPTQPPPYQLDPVESAVLAQEVCDRLPALEPSDRSNLTNYVNREGTLVAESRERGTPVSTIRSREKRAIEKLQEKLEG